MLALHLEGRPLESGFDFGGLAKMLAYYSASDLRFLVDEAARDALGKNEDMSIKSFRTAMAKVPASTTPQVEAQYQSIQQRGL